MIGLLGKKLGMTHVYDEFGRRRAVTAIHAGPCAVLRVREPARHGYRAVQVGFETIAEKKCHRAQLGQFKKANSGPFRYVREFRLPAGQAGYSNGAVASNEAEGKKPEDQAEVPALNVGAPLTVGLFQAYELVDVTGISIGKGFQGGVKRWHWKGGAATHGSMSHRAPGSIGSTTTPGRVWRGHHLPGHMGARRVTVQNLRVVRVDAEANLLLVEGAVPGADRQLVMVTKSTKHPGWIKKPQAFQVVVEEEENAKKPAKKK